MIFVAFHITHLNVVPLYSIRSYTDDVLAQDGVEDMKALG